MSRPDGRGESAALVAARWAIGAAAVAVVAIALILALTPDASDGDPTVDVAARLCLLLAVAAGAVVVLSSLRSTTRAGLTAGLVAVFLFAGAALVLSGSEFPPLGLAFDQGFRAASITKYAHSIALVDFAYKGLPAYYPPLFFWLLGRLSAWAGIESYEALKIGLLLTVLVVPLLALELWRELTRDWMVAVAVVVAGLAFTDWYEPYGWLSVVVFVPWFLLWLLQVGRRDDLSPAMTAAGMVIGAALLMTFYYPFFIGATALVLLALPRRLAARHGVLLGPKFPRRTAIVLAGTAVLSAVYWLPLLVSTITTPGAQSYQNRYLDPVFVDVPLPFLSFDVVGIVLLFGLVYLLFSALRSPVSMALLAFLAGAYVWVGVGYVGILIGTPLLTAKVVPVIEYTLAVAAGTGAVDIGRQVAAQPVVRRHLGAGGLFVVLGGLALVVAVALGQTAIASIPFVTEQRAASAPRTLLAEFERATRGRYVDSVALTDVEEIPELLPVYVFNVWNAHYANPASEFDDRTRFLRRLAREKDPEVFAAALDRNRYDHVDSVAFHAASGELRYTFFEDAFPRGVARTTITFDESQFSSPWFRRVDGTRLTVFVPRGHPYRTLDDTQRRALAHRYRGDLNA